jgi:hypothetical protein
VQAVNAIKIIVNGMSLFILSFFLLFQIGVIRPSAKCDEGLSVVWYFHRQF